LLSSAISSINSYSGENMGVWEFIFSRILGREYPLISIKKGVKKVPYYTNWPDVISLSLDKRLYPLYNLKTPRDLEKFYIAVLEHEYLHYLLSKKFGAKTSTRFDRINSWSIKSKVLRWGVHEKMDLEPMISNQSSKTVRAFFTGLSFMAFVYNFLAGIGTAFLGWKIFCYTLATISFLCFWSNLKQLLRKG